MRWFRLTSQFSTAPGRPKQWSTLEIRQLLQRCFAPEHFFLGAGVDLVWEYRTEEIPWEIFKGRLLEPSHSRATQVFEAWNAYWREHGNPSEPILSLKLDYPRRQIHVVRAIHCHVWEAYDAGGNVILSRETTRWVRERVGTVSLDEFENESELQDEIMCQLFQAVVGCSRLPLTSLEAPLPAFTVGQMAYFFQSTAEQKACPLRSTDELIRQGLTPDLAPGEKAKLLEIVLRATSRDRLSEAAGLFVARWKKIGLESRDLVALFRNLFEEVSLSPYTDFVDKTLCFIEHLEQQGAWTTEQRVDFLSWLLRHISRHLTAYDLVTFHHRGANYPDALLLDAILKTYLHLIEAQPDLFLSAKFDTNQSRKRFRRRALRQGWLLRRWYEGHPVPQAPTSPGENARMLPPAFPRVPEEEILQPEKRRHRLFESDGLDLHWNEHADIVLQESILDLDHPDEFQELGMALFLDRPLGVFKGPGEIDQTPLLSYEAFSRAVAEKRVRFFADKSNLLAPDRRIALEARLRDLKINGFHPSPEAEPARPGSVSISDALKASPDFVILRTTKNSAKSFLECFRFDALPRPIYSLVFDKLEMLVVRKDARDPPGILSIYDGKGIERFELSIDASQGYHSRAGLELPRAGLRLIKAWGKGGQPMKLPPVSIPIR